MGTERRQRRNTIAQPSTPLASTNPERMRQRSNLYYGSSKLNHLLAEHKGRILENLKAMPLSKSEIVYCTLFSLRHVNIALRELIASGDVWPATLEWSPVTKKRELNFSADPKLLEKASGDILIYLTRNNAASAEMISRDTGYTIETINKLINDRMFWYAEGIGLFECPISRKLVEFYDLQGYQSELKEGGPIK